MIYCNIKKNNVNSAVYLFGIDLEDMTGEVEFDSSFTEPKIIKQPDLSTVPVGWLSKIVVKYKEDLAKGNFPERMSYER